MADKQATVYIVDVGRSMGQKHSGRTETDLDFGMRYVWDKIATTMSAGRKTFTVGIVGLRTDGTKNALVDDDGYQHISILQPIGAMLMPQLKTLQDNIQVSRTEVGDAVSAIIIAIEMIESFTKKLKYVRKIVLLTNARGHIDTDDVDEVAKKLNQENIELVVVGVDFDDADYGYKEEDKPKLKATNEALLKSLTDKCTNAVFGTVAEAVENLSIPTVKETRPYSTYKGQLTLGDPSSYDSAMCIDVERYFRTKVAKPVSASSYVTSTDPANGTSAQSSHTIAGDDGDMEMGEGGGDGLTSVKLARTYRVNDESAPGGKRDVDREDLAKGFEYGRTAVPISESDENVTKLETVQSFSIIGFIPSEKYNLHFNMGESQVTMAMRTNEKARMAFSSLVHALHELDSYAVARIVLKDGKEPQLLLLAPSIEPDLECLVDVPLPFAEDVRLYRFAPLDRVVTVSGATLTKHRNIPTESLTEAMSAYVDSMDISTYGKDDEGGDTEYMKIEDTYSPVLHRINQAIRRRAVRPDEAVQPPPDILMKFSNPPSELVTTSSSKLKKLIAAADVKQVPPKVRGKRLRDTIKPISGLDVDSLLGNSKRVSAENAIPEYKQMLTTAESVSTIKEASDQMGETIRSLIKHSLGDSGYERAIANLTVMNEELTALEEPKLYNDFIRELKTSLLAGELGGDRRDMMWLIRRARLGLIEHSRCEESDVTEAEAAKFYDLRPDLVHRGK